MHLPRIRIDASAFWQGFGLGAALGALGCIVFELWIHRIETGEIDPPEGYEEEVKRETTVLEEESRERVTLNRQFEKPALEDLVRDTGKGDRHVDYSSFSSAYSTNAPERLSEAPREELGSSLGELADAVKEWTEKAPEDSRDTYRDEEGGTHAVVEEESDTVEQRVFDVTLEGDRELSPMERVQMHRRYLVITADSYETERPYNDKYECTYFTREHILAGFDGDLRPVADNMLWGVVHEAISVKGVRNLYIRDLEGDSDFRVLIDDRPFDEVYEAWYGEERES